MKRLIISLFALSLTPLFTNHQKLNAQGVYNLDLVITPYKSSLEKIYKNLESGMPENKSIKEYALPNARQWLGGRFVAIWVLPIYFLRKIAKFSASSAFVKPYSPSENGPSYKQPETLFTSLRSVFRGEDHLRFFDHRFIGIWVLPIALTGIVFEILLIAPTNNTSPFN